MAKKKSDSQPGQPLVRGKKKLGTDLPAESVDRFNAYLDGKGFDRSAGTVGAFRLFEVIPPELREWLSEGNFEAAQDWIQAALREMTRAQAMQIVAQNAQSPQESRVGERRKAAGGTGQ